VVLTPRRWRQVSGKHPADDGDKKARSPGRSRRKPLKPLRAGMPGDFRCDRCEYSCASCTNHFAHEAAGALGTRHSPRPLLGGRFLQNLGRVAPRESNACVQESCACAEAVIARSGATEAIQLTCLLCDGLLRGACHRAALCADPSARNDALKDLAWLVENLAL
jgi:hypothetical protein